MESNQMICLLYNTKKKVQRINLPILYGTALASEPKHCFSGLAGLVSILRLTGWPACVARVTRLIITTSLFWLLLRCQVEVISKSYPYVQYRQRASRSVLGSAHYCTGGHSCVLVHKMKPWTLWRHTIRDISSSSSSANEPIRKPRYTISFLSTSYSTFSPEGLTHFELAGYRRNPHI